MKIYLYLLPAVLTMSVSCTDGKKFQADANSATIEKPEANDDSKPAPTPAPASDIVPVVKIGVNFEDTLSGDQDFNDAVLCFEGGFDFNTTATTITSSKDQKVKATASSRSNCSHIITAEIVGADGKVISSRTYESTFKGDIPLDFKKGDRLEVYMQPDNNDRSKGCDPTLKRDMHNKVYAAIDINDCRTTGK